jgi:serine/threonine-protein kinase
MAAALGLSERAFQHPRLSPDGKQLLVTITENDRSDVWVSEPERGTMTRLTFEANNASAIWAPDGKRLIFSSDRSGPFNMYAIQSDGLERVERLTTSENIQMPTSWSADGKLAFTEWDPSAGFDLWLLTPDGRPESFLRTSFNEIGAMFSPDGRWIAYVSDESGEYEVYVREYETGVKHPISVGGGTEPVWSPNGRELYYRNKAWMMAVSIEMEPRFAAGKPEMLFEAPYAESTAAYPNFDVAPDGNRFIMIQSTLESSATTVVVVLNWFEELKSRVPHSP